MNVLILLAFMLCMAMVMIGGKKGAISFVSLFINFLVLLFTVYMMNDPGNDPILWVIIACVIISCVNLFFINGINTTTLAAFLSTVATMIVLLLFILFLTDLTMINGFGAEEIDELSLLSLYIGISFVELAAAVIIISTIGAITDISISISSPMREFHLHNPRMSRSDLVHAGFAIGRDLLGTSTNTLFFAFFGSYLALLIWFKDLSYSLGDIINSKIFAAEMITILCAGIGIALVIPIASWITAFLLTRKA
ncbi:YibE/F family protein [Planococcus sp. CP5-4]|uniref:YibE/F family protein n=1 Tax=unclassified Planococcus (in: firmicutes) TaxID=2662419 RepID=UPI001C216273|nr:MULTISPECIES: YibE/F family protein [unclassified Planococcus (in: firmicutes)]MBU9674045.1 YibE/F family protein [Planococcus sp. CP5-4_YE]MBV0909916.1 YibE/F family protein [Planococcus sp. CP5-4_UN]MBW6064796.1 YibE/F family protein [Planococcus sp. CP5-4]